MLKSLRVVMVAAGVAASVTVGVAFSAPAIAAQPAAPSYVPAAKMAAVKSAPAIVEGASGKNVKSTIYVFMDPNCIFCHYAWGALQPYEAAGLQVHWIPLGFLKADSPGKAAALLQAQDGAALMHQNETNYSEKDESGGITPLNPIPPQIQTKLDADSKLFQDLGFDSTPTIIYLTHDGRWAYGSGLPHLRALPALLNLPEQPITDPALQRFR